MRAAATADTTSPLVAFLEDADVFQDCAADYTLFAGRTREQMAASCDEIRQSLLSAAEARENGMRDYAACLRLMNAMLGNIEQELGRVAS